jgi:small nuclear ribonucleoprotein (snRNP)-like protein
MTDPQTERQELADFLDQPVVLDTRGDLIYIGTLQTVGDWFLVLAEADVHDLQSTRTSKELYVMDSAKHGVKKNRELVHVRKSEVVSISKLEDVTIYG